MLFSAPLEVARTKAWTLAPSCDERVGQVRAHEAVRAGDEHGAALVDVAELPASGRRALPSESSATSLIGEGG